MKAVLWMKSSCTTCRNAKAKLAELGIDVEVRDYFKKPLEACELEQMLPQDPEAIVLMVMDNNLLKRPILVHPGGVIIGFDAGAYAKLVP